MSALGHCQPSRYCRVQHPDEDSKYCEIRKIYVQNIIRHMGLAAAFSVSIEGLITPDVAEIVLPLKHSTRSYLSRSMAIDNPLSLISYAA